MELNEADGTLLQQGMLFAERYHVIKILGKGGMGEVYLAHDSVVQENIALKVMLPHLVSQGSMLKRFQREIVLTRKVSSPHIVRTFECGFEGNLPFFTMEHIDGSVLKELIKDSKLSIPESIGIIYSVLLGLEAIHEQGIIHRDIKPGNVMIGSNNQVKIGDFGVAWPGSSELTKTSEVVGSGGYLAPELWTTGSPDSRSDIYAVGCLALELSTGHPPFERDSNAQLMYAHLTDTPSSIIEHNRKTPSWWSDLVAAMLAKDPSERPASVEVVLEQIETNVEDDPRTALCSLLSSDSNGISQGSRVRKRTSFSSNSNGEVERSRVKPVFYFLTLLVLVTIGIGAYPYQLQKGNSTLERTLIANSVPESIGTGIPFWQGNGVLAMQAEKARQPKLRFSESLQQKVVAFDGVDDYYDLQGLRTLFARADEGVTLLTVARSFVGNKRYQRRYLFSSTRNDGSSDLFRLGFDLESNAVLVSTKEKSKGKYHISRPVKLYEFALYTLIVTPNKFTLRRNSQLLLTEDNVDHMIFRDLKNASIGQEYDRERPSDFFLGEVAFMQFLDRPLTENEARTAEDSIYQRFPQLSQKRMK